MKKLWLFFLLVAISFAEVPSFKDYQTALNEAKKKDKLLMIVIEQEKCPWCHRFKAQTLSDIDVEILIEEHFVLLFLDKNKDEIPNFLKVPVTPVTFLVGTDEKTYNETIGYVNKFHFKDQIEATLIELNKL